MKTIDANILIYAMDTSSVHHERARGWLQAVYAEDDCVGLPRLVLLAFLRIVTNPRIMKIPAPTELALSRIESLVSHPKSVILDCGPNHWSIFKGLVANAQVFGPSMTDAHLAAIAIEHGSILCSHDNGFRRFVGLKFENPL